MLSSTQELQVCHSGGLHSSPHLTSFPGFLVGALSTIIEFENSKGESAASTAAPSASGSSPELLGCSTRAHELLSNTLARHKSPDLHRAVTPRSPGYPPQQTTLHTTPYRREAASSRCRKRQNLVFLPCAPLRTALKAGDTRMPVLRNLVTQEDHSCSQLCKKLFHCGFVGLESKYSRQKPQCSIYLVK